MSLAVHFPSRYKILTSEVDLISANFANCKSKSFICVFNDLSIKVFLRNLCKSRGIEVCKVRKSNVSMLSNYGLQNEPMLKVHILNRVNSSVAGF